MESDKNTKASELINRFRSLVNHAESVAFPQTKNNIFLPVSMDIWVPIKRILYKASLPYLYINEKGKESILYLILSLFIFAMTFSAWILAEKTAKIAPIDADWLRFSFLIIYLFLSLYGVLGFLRDSRYPVVVRFFVFIFILLASVITAGSLFPVNSNNAHAITSFDRYFKVLFLTFAVLSTILLFFINTLLIVLLSYVQLLRFTKTIQTPMTDQAIEELLRAEIVDVVPNSQNWRLLDLSKKEILYLRLWSESNLNSSEKRTTPAIVVVALSGLFLSMGWVRDFLAMSTKVNSSGNSQTWLNYLLLIILFSFIVIFSETMVAIFKNIAVQSLIIEACLVAEYAVDEKKEIQIKKSNSLLGILFKAIVQKIVK
jgi:hypothetical protein